jgi:hypothetical protein
VEPRWWSLGTVRAQRVDPATEAIAEGIRALISRQNQDGSWGSDHPLDKVVSTCHATMALLAIGTPASDPRTSRALAFLASSYVSTYQWGFWRIAPMIGVSGYERLVSDDLEAIETRIATHASPSPDQPLTTFVARAYEWLGDAQSAEAHVAAIVGSYTADHAWAGRSDATSHALSATLNSPYADTLSDAMFDRAVDLIALQAARQAPGRVSWHDVVTSTAYVVMNILETDRLRSDPRLAPLLGQAQDFLLARQGANRLWPVERPPYGGDLEITGPDYYSAVAIRGLIALGQYSDPTFVEKIWYILTIRTVQAAEALEQHVADLRRDLAREQAAAHALRRAWQAAVGILLILLLLPKIPPIAENLGLTGRADSDVRLGRYGSYASLIALAITLFLGAASLWRRRRTRRLTDRGDQFSRSDVQDGS